MNKDRYPDLSNTFGGTDPRLYRLYLSRRSRRFDEIRDFAPEVTPKKGDALVSDASSRLAWLTHATTDLNHAELLWNQPLMRQVAGLLGSGRTAGRIPEAVKVAISLSTF